MLLFSARLPWEVTAVMLADTIEGYKQKEQSLISEFCRCFDLPMMHKGLVNWVERQNPRKYVSLDVIMQNTIKFLIFFNIL